MKDNKPEMRKEDNKNNQFFSEDFYKKLCPRISELTRAFDNQKRPRDIVTLSLTTMLSGCFPRVYGIYGGRIVRANLYAIVSGPAGTGKSAIQFAKTIGDKIEDGWIKKNDKIRMAYKEELNLWKATQEGPEPQEPKEKYFFIPGDSSAAGMKQQVAQNDGRGVIFETEADVLIQIFGQKYGDYSDMLRKAFHHERISSYRKTKSERISIETPTITMLLTGTPDQLTGLIKGVENGLFSRLINYAYDDQPIFLSPFSAEHLNIVSMFERFAEEVAQNYFKSFEEPEREFRFQQHQIEKFNERFGPMVNEFYTGLGNEAVGIPMRSAFILFRIAMVLSAVRDVNGSGDLICDDRDFEAATLMTNTLLDHSLAVYNSLPFKDENKKGGVADELLLNAMKDEFEARVAQGVMSQLGFSKRTTFRMLRRLCDKGVLKTLPKPGSYAKVK